MTPTTKAGRALLGYMQEVVDWWRAKVNEDQKAPQYVDAFLSAMHNIEHSLGTIEAEARQQERERIRAALNVARDEHSGYPSPLDVDVILAESSAEQIPSDTIRGANGGKTASSDPDLSTE